MRRIGAGDPAPNVALPAHTGQWLSPADPGGDTPVVPFFYPLHRSVFAGVVRNIARAAERFSEDWMNR